MGHFISSEEWVWIRDDVLSRSRQGLSPDWLTYVDRLVRLTSGPLERIRQVANGALVAGMAGTMTILLLELLLLDLDIENVPWSEVKPAAICALLSSCVGIGNHLWIVLGLLKSGQHNADELVREFERKIARLCADHPPSAMFGEAVRSELAGAFRDAVERFPQAFQRLDENVESLGAIIERQTGTIVGASESLSNSVAGLDVMAVQLTEASMVSTRTADNMLKAVQSLGAVPDNIRVSLVEVYEAWKGELTHAQDGFVQRVDSMLDRQRHLMDRLVQEYVSHRNDVARWLEIEAARHGDIVNGFTELTTALGMFPSAFESIVQTAVEGLQREARKNAGVLAETLLSDRKALNIIVEDGYQQMRRHFVTNTERIVQQIFDELGGHIRDSILEPLREVGDKLQMTVNEMPPAAKEFGQSLNEAANILKGMPKILMATHDELHQIARLSEESQTELAAKLWGFLEDTKAVHTQMDQTVEKLVGFIRHLIQQTAGSP